VVIGRVAVKGGSIPGGEVFLKDYVVETKKGFDALRRVGLVGGFVVNMAKKGNTGGVPTIQEKD